jgi:hypothetical protein
MSAATFLPQVIVANAEPVGKGGEAICATPGAAVVSSAVTNVVAVVQNSK